MGMSRSFGKKVPIHDHLARGRHGLKGEVADLYASIDEAFFALENWSDHPTVDASHTAYVSKAGNDTTGDGTNIHPFLTIARALDSIVDNSITDRYVIMVGPGSFADPWGLKPWVGIVGAASPANGATPNGGMLTEISAPADTIGFHTSWVGAVDFGIGFLNFLGFTNHQTWDQVTRPGIKTQINADTCSFTNGASFLGPGTLGYDNVTLINCISYGGFIVRGWQYLWMRQCTCLGGTVLVQAGPAGATSNTTLLAQNCSIGAPSDPTALTVKWVAPSPAGVKAIALLVNTSTSGLLTLDGVHTQVTNVVGTTGSLSLVNGATSYIGRSLGVHTVTSGPGAAPGVAPGGASGAGASVVIDPDSTDNSGSFELTTGAGAGTGAQVVVTYAVPYPVGAVEPNPVFSRTDAQTVGQFYVSAFTNTGFILSASVAPAPGVVYGFTFFSMA